MKPGQLSPCGPVRTLLFLALIVPAGCNKGAPSGKPISVEPEVQLVKPQKRDLRHVVGQPGYIYAYEQTAIYPKISGFIDRWYVDIGAKIKKDQPLADLFVPELHARYKEKQEMVKLSGERVKQAESLVEVAKSNVALAKADIKKYEALVARWESEVRRLNDLTNIVDRQVLAETQLRLKSDKAALEAAQAGELARKADLAKARVDVSAANAQVEVDKAAEADLAALVGYTHLRAPYDGIVVTRNANNGDYVEPRYGDASVPQGGYVSQSPAQGIPIYVVARTDKVRVYVDVPAVEANYVHGPTADGPGNKAHVRVQADNDADIPGEVMRTSWALNFRSRTLRAEIDLPNRNARLLPGMYAFGEVVIERKKAMTLPQSAVLEIGNETCCYLYEDGKAIRTPVQTGIHTGKWVEVFRKKVKDEWAPFSGAEKVIVGDIAELRDGEKVEVAQDGAKQ